MDYLNNDREIDDAGLNQDSTFDKKAEEDFDNSDDFHKYDHTDKDAVHQTEDSKTSDQREKNDLVNNAGRFDGYTSV